MRISFEKRIKKETYFWNIRCEWVAPIVSYQKVRKITGSQTSQFDTRFRGISSKVFTDTSKWWCGFQMWFPNVISQIQSLIKCDINPDIKIICNNTLIDFLTEFSYGSCIFKTKCCSWDSSLDHIPIKLFHLSEW